MSDAGPNWGPSFSCIYSKTGVFEINEQANQVQFPLYLNKSFVALVGELGWCNATFD